MEGILQFSARRAAFPGAAATLRSHLPDPLIRPTSPQRKIADFCRAPVPPPAEIKRIAAGVQEAPAVALGSLLSEVRSVADTAPDDVRCLGLDDAALFASRVEELSRTVEYLQIIAAGQLERARTAARAEAAGAPAKTRAAAGWTTGWRDRATENGTAARDTAGGGVADAGAGSPGVGFPGAESRRAAFADEFRNTTEYLRVLLRISSGEARRRLALAETALPKCGIAGQEIGPAREHLAATLKTGTISSHSATIITLTLDKTPRAIPAETAVRIEKTLTTAAQDNDPDFLARLAKRLLDTINQDGAEPSEEELRHTQGAFLRRPKNGLKHLEIFATQDQYEHLLTVMNAATNPRLTPENQPRTEGAPEDDAARLDRRSRPQKLLDGLVGACKTALASGSIPTNGGLRPQIMATISYEQLFQDVTATETRTGTGTGTGTFTFTGPVTPATIRQLACDADIIPVLLGGEGQILDIGRASRIFPPHIRKAIATRDQGCAFPSCTMPIPWCEAHHISYWSRGGPTNVDNGTLLCSHHHHVIHKEHWKIEVRTGVPWFIPPPHIDPHQQPRRNHYFEC